MTKTKKIAFISVLAILLLAIVLIVSSVVSYYRRLLEIGLSKDVVPNGFGKEAKVIILAGQSNAAGCSRDDYLKKNVTAEKYAEYERGYDNVYINYYASATNESSGFVKSSVRQGEGGICFGPELGLAEKLNELYPDETFFIIKYAWGGTNLYEQWRSPSGGNMGPLYNGFIEYVNTSIRYLELKNYEVNIEAMCWMQGESDSLEEQHAVDYEQNLLNFISDVRGDFSEYASDDGIAFVDAYIAATIFWKYYTVLNNSKQNVADSSPINTVIDTISHGLTVTEEPEGEPDIAHYDSLSEIKLGHLFGEECAKFFD